MTVPASVLQTDLIVVVVRIIVGEVDSVVQKSVFESELVHVIAELSEKFFVSFVLAAAAAGNKI